MKTRKGYLIRRGKTYYAVWTISGKKFCKTTKQTDKKEAVKELSRLMQPFLVEDEVRTLETVKARIEGAKSEMVALDELQHPPLTCDKAWNAFERSPLRPDAGESTLRQYASELKRLVKWLVKNHAELKQKDTDAIAMRDISAAIAGEYAQHLTQEKVSASTFNQHINFLRLLWRVLATEAKTTVNPWDGIARKKLQALANRKRALTRAQYEALTAAALTDPDIRDLMILLAWTGLRLVDGVRMPWGNVDFTRRVITVFPQKTMRRTGKGVNIPIFPELMDVLNRRQAELPTTAASKYVFKSLVADYEKDAGAYLSKRIRAIFEKIKLQTTEKHADRGRSSVLYGAHSFRHFFVTAATEAGMPPAMIKAITGHSSDTMLEHYQHIGDQLAVEFAKRIGTTAPPALPPADVLADLKGKIRAIAETLNTRNAVKVKEELLVLAK